MRRNAFAARPKHFHGRPLHGTIKFPGFHTTDILDIAKAYAHAKVDAMTPSEWGATLKKGWTYPMWDYPVIVTLDMRGLKALPDYDAFEYWLQPAADFLREFMQYSPYMRDTTFAKFERYLNTYDGDTEQETPHNTSDALGQIWGMFGTSDVAYRIRSWLEAQLDPDAALRAVLRNPQRDDFLMNIAHQYRYDQDIEEKRITGVWYMLPFFDKLWPHYDDPEWESDQCEKRIDNIEAAGYATITMGNITDNQDPSALILVYEAPPPRQVAEQLHMFGHKPEPRLEYHGTTYKNLCDAARELAKRIPKPPPPYQEDAPGDIIDTEDR